MANIRELDKRRKSVRNIRKITRTMELIATARFKKAMDRDNYMDPDEALAFGLIDEIVSKRAATDE